MRLSLLLWLSLFSLGTFVSPAAAQDATGGAPSFGQLPDARDEHYLLMLAKQKAEIEALQNEVKRLKQALRNKGGSSALVSPAPVASVVAPSTPTISTPSSTDAAGVSEQLQKAEQEVLNSKVTMHYNLGRLHHKNKKPVEAEKHYLFALSMAPQTPNLHYNLGVLYDDYLHNAEKAKKHYQTFLLLKPSGPDSAMVQKWLSEL